MKTNEGFIFSLIIGNHCSAQMCSSVHLDFRENVCSPFIPPSYSNLFHGGVELAISVQMNDID